MKSCYFFFWFPILIFFSPYSYSQENLKFQHLKVEQGLSQSTVLATFQDSKGFMWFGTRDGLNKYDGYEFTVYKNDPLDNFSISSNVIHAIVEDKEGNLWIGTATGGLNKFDREKEIFIRYKPDPLNPNSICSDVVYSLEIDFEGILWIGTATEGLNSFNPSTETFVHYKHNPMDPTSISDYDIRDILEDKEHDLWFATHSGGVNLFDKKKKKFSRFTHDKTNPKSLSHNSVWALHEDKFGNLWVGSYGGGLNLLDKAKREFKCYKKDNNNLNSLGHNSIVSLTEDESGNIYIGTENGGLSIFAQKKNKFYNYPAHNGDNNTLNSSSLNSMFKDKEGNIWIGTFNGGVNLINTAANTFTHYTHNPFENSLSDNKVLCIYEDSKENLWIGTDGGGLNLFNRKTGKFSYYKHTPGNKNTICGNYVLRVYEDKNGNLWIGTWGDGLTVMNPEKKTFKHFKHDPKNKNSISGNNCWGFLHDSDGNMWIATFGNGLNLYDPKTETFTHFKHEPGNPKSLTNDRVYNIYEDSRKNIWVGTDVGGLNLYDKKTKTFSAYIENEQGNSISNNSVDCIMEDKHGNLWLATDRGLTKFEVDKKHFTTYLTKDGLPNDIIMGILEDDNGNIWVSTYKGLSKFNPSTKIFKNYTVAEGLQSSEFKEEAYCKSRTGKLYFGGINGFNEFNPDDLPEKTTDPPIVIMKLKIFNQDVPINKPFGSDTILRRHISQTEEIKLSYQHSVFSFDFASLNFTIPERKQYQYLLEGFDKEWNFIGTKRTATYTNLEPGDYVFKVKSLTTAGTPSKNIAKIKIKITPPYWKTWWFKIGSSLFLLSCFAGFFLIRIQIIKKQKRVLVQLVDERTSELKKANESISSQGEKLKYLYSEIKDSIKAAEEIQKAILPSEKFIKKYLPESFILNAPKDVVSGDLYWFDVVENKIIIASVDCTGHGVSGAFMSIHAHHLLNQSIYPYKDLVASEILNRINKGLQKELKHNEDERITLEGMDISLCIIDTVNNTLQFAGGNQQLYYIRNNELTQIKGNRFSIGLPIFGPTKDFSNHEIALQKGDTFYLFSDGYADQIGRDGEKYQYKRFREFINIIHQKPMAEQPILLERNLIEWRGEYEQLDDIMVIGFKI